MKKLIFHSKTDLPEGQESSVSPLTESDPNETAPQKRFRLSWAMRCFLIVMVGVAITAFAARWIEYRELLEEKAELQRQINEYEDSIAEMQEELDEEMSREYIIRVARDKLHLYFPDDVIYYNDLNK